MTACGATSEPEKTADTVIVEHTRLGTEEGGEKTVVATVVVEQTKTVKEEKEDLVTDPSGATLAPLLVTLVDDLADNSP